MDVILDNRQDKSCWKEIVCPLDILVDKPCFLYPHMCNLDNIEGNV